MSKGPLTAVLGLLKLANMFRFGWIEPKAKDAARRQRGDIPEDILRRFGSIAAESFTLGLDTEQAVLLAFNEDDGAARGKPSAAARGQRCDGGLEKHRVSRDPGGGRSQGQRQPPRSVWKGQ
jgi:hypothetical protein